MELAEGEWSPPLRLRHLRGVHVHNPLDLAACGRPQLPSQRKYFYTLQWRPGPLHASAQPHWMVLHTSEAVLGDLYLSWDDVPHMAMQARPHERMADPCRPCNLAPTSQLQPGPSEAVTLPHALELCDVLLRLAVFSLPVALGIVGQRTTPGCGCPTCSALGCDGPPAVGPAAAAGLAALPAAEAAGVAMVRGGDQGHGEPAADQLGRLAGGGGQQRGGLGCGASNWARAGQQGGGEGGQEGWGPHRAAPVGEKVVLPGVEVGEAAAAVSALDPPVEVEVRLHLQSMLAEGLSKSEGESERPCHVVIQTVSRQQYPLPLPQQQQQGAQQEGQQGGQQQQQQQEEREAAITLPNTLTSNPAHLLLAFEFHLQDLVAVDSARLHAQWPLPNAVTFQLGGGQHCLPACAWLTCPGRHVWGRLCRHPDAAASSPPAPPRHKPSPGSQATQAKNQPWFPALAPQPTPCWEHQCPGLPQPLLPPALVQAVALRPGLPHAHSPGPGPGPGSPLAPLTWGLATASGFPLMQPHGPPALGGQGQRLEQGRAEEGQGKQQCRRRRHK
ncbi:hypothetical protein V8C86DRAFT_1006696 [Haematococcus lacustris]